MDPHVNEKKDKKLTASHSSHPNLLFYFPPSLFPVLTLSSWVPACGDAFAVLLHAPPRAHGDREHYTLRKHAVRRVPLVAGLAARVQE